MAECTGLLNRRRVIGSTGGSNPPLSANAQSFVCLTETRLYLKAQHINDFKIILGIYDLKFIHRFFFCSIIINYTGVNNHDVFQISLGRRYRTIMLRNRFPCSKHCYQ